MNWKVRHEGSPQFVEMTLEQIQQGLVDGLWEPTDEVQGPGETEWVALENHPTMAELIEELEPPPIKHYDDESHIDMNALIDVCLVLLVFFILTTTVAVLQKRMEAPSVEESGKVGVLRVTKEQITQSMIHVTAKMEGDRPVLRVESKEVDPDRLTLELRRFVRQSSKTMLLLEHDDNVPQDLVVRVIDSAKGAGMDKVRLLIP
ncbi:MAG: biopolymer transporter ExbD [Gemmataceae bacterium]